MDKVKWYQMGLSVSLIAAVAVPVAGLLSASATLKSEHPAVQRNDKDRDWLSRFFSRSIAFSDVVDSDTKSAKNENGVLAIILPKV